MSRDKAGKESAGTSAMEDRAQAPEVLSTGIGTWRKRPLVEPLRSTFSPSLPNHFYIEVGFLSRE